MSDGEDKPKPSLEPSTWHPWAQGALLFLGLPLLVPSLLWMFLGKRWRRAPLAAIAFHAVLLVIACFQVPRLTFVAVIAMAATATLYVWRTPKGSLEAAPACLGYSNAVVLSFVVGGTLTMLGGCAVLPMGPLMHTSNLYRSPANVTTKELGDNRIPVPKRVEVRDAKVDSSRAFYRLPGPPAWFERMPPEQKSDALEAWVPLEGTRDEVWVVFMGTNLVRMTEVVEGHLVTALPVDVAALAAAQGLGATPPPRGHKKHGQPPPAAPAPPVARLIMVGSPQEVAERTGRTDETKITFDWTWAWLLAIGLVLVAFGIWRSVEESRT